MATNILMPALSPTMTEGTLSRWLKKEGEAVRAGDVIAEIETDKATMEVEAVDEGVLGKILVADGTQGVKVNEPIAVLVDEGEAVPTAAPAAKPVAAPAPAPTPKAEPAKAEPARQETKQPETPRPTPQATAPAGNGHDSRRRPHLCLAAGAAHGEAGRHRSGDAEGQRTERPHRQGRHRGSAAKGPRRPCCHRDCDTRADRRTRAGTGRSPRRTSWCRTVRSGR